MEVVFAIPILFIPFIWPLITGLMAKSNGRKFWPWFFIGIPLPFLANIVLLCLPDKSNRQMKSLTANTNQNPINGCGEEEIDLSALT